MTLILFDVDGTLTATGAADARCFAEAYEKVFGRAIPTTDWNAYTHVTDTGILDQALRGQRGATYTADELKTFEGEYLAGLKRAAEKNPGDFIEVRGARALLEAVQESPHHIAALASGGMRACAHFKVANIGFDPASLPGGFANHGFTRSAIARHAIAEADSNTDDIVYVGDGLWDIRTSRELGLRFVGITWESSRKRLEDAGATHCLADLSDRDAFFDAVRHAGAPGHNS